MDIPTDNTLRPCPSDLRQSRFLFMASQGRAPQEITGEQAWQLLHSKSRTESQGLALAEKLTSTPVGRTWTSSTGLYKRLS